MVYIDKSAAQGVLVRGRTDGTIASYMIEKCLGLEPGASSHGTDAYPLTPT